MVVMTIMAIFCYDGVLQAEPKAEDTPRWAVPRGDGDRGPAAIIAYGCFSCHAVKGIRRATGRVGPKLHDIQEQMYIAGVLTNSPGNMIDWIREPSKFSPETAMPDLEVSDKDARDITAYLLIR